MKLQRFIYYNKNNQKKTIQVQICKSLWSKASGLMFKKNSPPLLFVFNKEKDLSIHSFFCKPFQAVWIDKNKKVTKTLEIKTGGFNFSGNGKYLLEIPLKI